jgi:resuscitation-promoting factor RpfA
MRLVCPNCEAKYEVPEDAIPETGRDVQCANCGHAWFQMRSRAATPDPVPVAAAPVAPVVAAVMEPTIPEAASEPEAALLASELAEVAVEAEAETKVAEEPASVMAEASAGDVIEAVALGDAGLPDPPVDEPTVPEIAADEVSDPAIDPTGVASEETAAVDAEISSAEAPAAEVPAHASPVEETFAGGDAEPEFEQALAAEEEPEPEPATDAKPAAYAVDDSVLAILREEAEREAQARRVDVKPLEVQPDLGIEAAMLPAKKTVEVISSDTEKDDGTDAGDAKPSARRDLLPNVEEINSTLRPSENSADGEAVSEGSAPAVETRSSFRSGFLLVMTVTILASALYMSADTLSAAIPALAGPLDAFVGFVDGLRLQLDGLMQNATVAINGDGN